MIVYEIVGGRVRAWGDMPLPDWFDPLVFSVDVLTDDFRWAWLDKPPPYRHSDGSYHAEPEG